MIKSKIISFFTFLLFLTVLNAQKKVDILLIGGGAGGTSAGIQAARMGARVQIIESTSWLGGMLTSAGVSAIDGNHNLPSGIWGEFRQRLRDHYGGAEALATGWVSHTLFEPSVGNKILKDMANIPNLDVAYNAVYIDVLKDGEGWLVNYRQEGQVRTIKTKILIDATETGELLPLVGADFRLGMDSKGDTGEKEAPDISNMIVQDLTYVAILKDTKSQKGRRGLVKKPKNYDPKEFECACKREDAEMFSGINDCLQMLNYGKLPNNKYMLNWPNCGNDFYVNWPELTSTERKEKIQEAKAFSQGFVYYIQNDLGFKNLRLFQEFPSSDNFPMIPYNREGRRIKGKVFLTVEHLEKPYDYKLYRTGIAVGDYPIDHHHDKNSDTPKIDFINIKVPSFNIPIGTLIPMNLENFVVAEKNISVSNITNGTTRLQPVVLGIGQAAGALAAQAIVKDIELSKVSVREVQEVLLEHSAYLMPYIDINPNDSAFNAMQRIGATGILKGFGVPFKWANQTWFYPERVVSEYEWKTGLLPYFPEIKGTSASGKGITLNFITAVVQRINPKYTIDFIHKNWESWHINQILNETTPLNRRSVSIITDKVLNPFEMEIDFDGNILKE